MEIRSQKIYWDQVSAEKRFAHPLRLDWLASHFSFEQSILDFGCGYGRILSKLDRSGYRSAVGADFSDGMLRRCHQLSPHLKIVQADAQRLPFTDNSYDAVLLFAVLTALPVSDQQRRLFSEVQRILRRGGLIYISDLLLNADSRNLDRYERYADQFGTYGIFQLPEGVVVRHHSEAWIRSLTEMFDCIEYEPFTAATMNGHSSAAFQYLGRLR
jgi:ubiquinone/menaquinone biosynthesis C-methylase UbiE